MPELATKTKRATEGMRHGRDLRVGDEGERNRDRQKDRRVREGKQGHTRTKFGEMLQYSVESIQQTPLFYSVLSNFFYCFFSF